MIDDPSSAEWREDISRLVLCSGRVYYDLERHAERARPTRSRSHGSSSCTRSRPTELAELLARLPEPRDGRVGAGGAAQHGRLAIAAPPPRGGDAAEGVEVTVESRPWRASPSEGYARDHEREQDRIVRAALGLAPAE